MGELFVKSSTIKSEDNVDGVSQDTKRFLKHELRHAAQDARNMMMEGKKPSVDQIAAVNKLSEAETRAWDIMGDFVDDYFNFDSQENFDDSVKSFMEYDFDPRNTPKEYEFQQLLRANKGDILKAQKALVGKMIVEGMSANFDGGDVWYSDVDDKWRNAYDKQALSFATAYFENGDISVGGNKESFDQALSYFTKEYGIQKKDIDKANLTKGYANGIDALKHDVKNGKMDPKTGALLKTLVNPAYYETVSSAGQSVQPPHVPSALERGDTTDHTATKILHAVNEGR